MFRLEIFSKEGTPLCEIHDISGLRWAYGRQLIFEIPHRHPKATADFLKQQNVVVLRYAHIPEPWHGYISEVDWAGGEGLITISCEHKKLMLSQRMTGVLTLQDVLPGEAFATLLNGANSVAHTGIHVGNLYMGQKRVSLEARREPVYDKVQEVCEGGNLEWDLEYVDPVHSIANLRERYGRDLTASIVVQGGFDTDGEPEFRAETSEWANEITGVGKLREGFEVPEGEDDYEYRPTVVRRNQVSIDRYGLRQATTDFSDTEDQSTLASQTEEELDKRAFPKITTALTLNNRRALWALFTDGDIITLTLPGYGFRGVAIPILILGREVDPDRELLTLAVEVVQGQRAQTLDVFLRSHYPYPDFGYLVTAPESTATS